MRGNLLGPLIRRAHRVRPAHRVVIVGLWPAELVQPRVEERRRLDGGHAVEVDHLVERAVQGALGGGAVVADDVVHQGVVEGADLPQRIEQAADVMVGEFEEARVDFHLPAQHRLEILWHRVPRGDLLVTCGEPAVRRDDAQRLLSRQGFLAQGVPTSVELALVLVRPFLRHVVRRVGGARREVDEERLVGHEGALLPDPADRLVSHIGHEMVTLFGRRLDLDRRRPFVQRGVPLASLSTGEAVEVLEAAAARGPGIERPGGARLPHRHLVAFAELRRGIAIELEGLGNRCRGIGQDRGVSRRAAGDLGDAPHAHRMVVAASQEGLARGRAQGRGVKARVLEPARGQPLRVRRLARAAESTRRAKPSIVDHDDEDIGRAFRRAQLLDGRVPGLRVLCIIRDQARSRPIRDREVGSVSVVATHALPLFHVSFALP
jgi:hypothetical protein